MNTQRLEQVPIDKLVPYARNARTHSKEQIAQLRSSLREFGFVSPAVIDNNYNILVGHGRIAAAREEGYKTVPCVFAEDLTDAQKRAYILADNQLALNAGWDEEMLSVELADLQENAFDLSLLGFDDKELEKLLNGESDKDVEDDDFDLTAALEKASFVETGDLWLRRHASGKIANDDLKGTQAIRLSDEVLHELQKLRWRTMHRFTSSTRPCRRACSTTPSRTPDSK
jgi:ParB-like chromosome segregation protein Spo0J